MANAITHFPQIDSNSYGIGFNTGIGILPTFEWKGFVWNSGYICTRLIWIGIAAAIVILSSIIFDRFRTGEKIHFQRRTWKKTRPESVHTKGIETVFHLATVQKANRVNILRLIKGELKIMSARQPLWWYFSVIEGIGFGATAAWDGGYR